MESGIMTTSAIVDTEKENAPTRWLYLPLQVEGVVCTGGDDGGGACMYVCVCD